METILKGLEAAAVKYLVSPSADLRNKYLQEFAGALLYKAEVLVMVDTEVGDGPTAMTFTEVSVEGNNYAGFFTSEDKADWSPYDSEFSYFAIDELARLVVKDKKLQGLVINPSTGDKVIISKEELMGCMQLVEDFLKSREG